MARGGMRVQPSAVRSVRGRVALLHSARRERQPEPVRLRLVGPRLAARRAVSQADG
jgi:hypothetical protein